MAMKDLQPDGVGLPRAGKIRLGYGKESEQGFTDADHFVLRDAPEVARALGEDRPRELPIFFPFDEVEECLTGFYKLYLGSGLWCKGDGEKVIYSVDKQSGKINIRDGIVQLPVKIDKNTEFSPGQEVPCPGSRENGRWPRCQFCKPSTTIIFMMRNIPIEDLRLAAYHIETRSKNNYPRLYEQLSYFVEKYGRLIGIPFILQRVLTEIGRPNLNKDGSRKKGRDGKLLPARARTKKWLLNLEVDQEWLAKMMQKDEILADPMREVAQIEAGEMVVQQDSIETERPQATNIYTARVNFCIDVSDHIKFYKDPQAVVEAMDELEIIYLPEEERGIYKALEAHAQKMADEAAETASIEATRQGQFQPVNEDEIPF